MEEIAVEDLVKKGTMVKDPALMSEAERTQWEVAMSEKARAYLYSIGQPMVYRKEGQMIAEYSDGRVEYLA